MIQALREPERPGHDGAGQVFEARCSPLCFGHQKREREIGADVELNSRHTGGLMHLGRQKQIFDG